MLKTTLSIINHTFGRYPLPIFFGLLGLIIVVMTSTGYYFQTSASATDATPHVSEIRGVWLTNVDSDVLFGRTSLVRALENLKELNFNTVYPTVWHSGYTLYPSAVAQKKIGRSLDPAPGLQGRDLLQELVTEAHQKGMRLIPWFEFGFMAPENSELAKRHPDWLTQNQDGSKTQHGGVWLNPFLPQVQQFIIDLITEIVTNYDIDGIQFDDHFSIPTEMGYDPYTIALYLKENPELTPTNANPQETYWVRWRADKLNEFITRLSHTVKARKPKCIISVSPNPLHFSLPAQLQDWFSWETDGLIDELILQVYRHDYERFVTELKRAEVRVAKSHIPVAVGIMTGLKGNPVQIEQIQAQVNTVRKLGFTGVSFFFYESLWNFGKEPLNERQSVFKELFPTPISR